MTADIEALVFPEPAREELVARLARAAGLGRIGAPDRFHLGYRDLAPALSRAAGRKAPAVLRVGPAQGAGALLAVVACRGGRAQLLGPDGTIRSFPEKELGAFLRAPYEREALPAVERAVARAALPGARAALVRTALLGAAPAADKIVEGWRLRRLSPSLAGALGEAGALRRLVLAALSYAIQLVLLVAAFWMVAKQAVGGDGDLRAWASVLVALVGTRLLASWAAGRLAVTAGEVLRTRLLAGFFALDTEPMRNEGIGQLLGRVMEIESVEALALGGGLQAMAAVFELSMGIVVLSLGSAGGPQIAILTVWLAVGALLAARFARALRLWSGLRLSLTHDLVERMVGHRTLVTQQPPELRHRDEDQALDAYARAGRVLDRDAALLTTLVPRGWLLVGLLALAPALASSGAGPGALATSLGGVLFIYGALRRAATAFPALAGATVAWQKVAPLLAGAAGWDAAAGGVAPRAGSPAAPDDGSAALISARELGFVYPGRAEPVLVGCALDVRRGDRILLEGPSGGGKSTLGAVLAGLRAPTTGVLALSGQEQGTLGLSSWRAHVGAVPQFHENHVFTASLLFNLLLGRGWPPRPEDVREAEALCRELDLGALLGRMPLGIEQLVGESGWQLSHGERSRVFIARSLLQRLDARILDESFAALDPETLERSLACVLRRAETLVVIAHP